MSRKVARAFDGQAARFEDALLQSPALRRAAAISPKVD
jgi:hypothetical protein